MPVADPTHGEVEGLALAPGFAPANDLFSRVSVGRISQVIVDQIKAVMLQGKLRAGDRLPTERELSQLFGVSRVTVREALRVLEASGLAEIRVGARGGTFVAAPTAESVGDDLGDLLSLAEITSVDVTEARLVLEVAIIPLVVERATKDDLADLERLVANGFAALEEDRYVMDMSAEFHVRLAECAHNSAIAMLIRSFHGAMRMSLEEAQVAEPRVIDPHIGIREHADLVAAIKRRDVDHAFAVMRRHIDRTSRILDGRISGRPV